MLTILTQSGDKALIDGVIFDLEHLDIREFKEHFAHLTIVQMKASVRDHLIAQLEKVHDSKKAKALAGKAMHEVIRSDAINTMINRVTKTLNHKLLIWHSKDDLEQTAKKVIGLQLEPTGRTISVRGLLELLKPLDLKYLNDLRNEIGLPPLKEGGIDYSKIDRWFKNM